MQVIPRERRTYLFSATMTSKVSKLQRASLSNPVKVEVNTKYDTASSLVQNFLFIPLKYKCTYLAALLTHYKQYSAMIFSNTCLGAQKTAIMLRHLGFSAICLHGKMTQTQRLGALNQFKAGTFIHACNGMLP
jgi:ATP-dependent RNA helicase DDX47/RRP3